MAIVVSEETGLISIAVKGFLERSITPDQLRLRLTDLLSPGRVPLARPAEQEAPL